MRLTIDVPDEYAEEVRRRLAEAGWNDAPEQVRRVLRYTIRHYLTHWWGTRRRWRLRHFDEAAGVLREPVAVEREA